MAEIQGLSSNHTIEDPFLFRDGLCLRCTDVSIPVDRHAFSPPTLYTFLFRFLLDFTFVSIIFEPDSTMQLDSIPCRVPRGGAGVDLKSLSLERSAVGDAI